MVVPKPIDNSFIPRIQLLGMTKPYPITTHFGARSAPERGNSACRGQMTGARKGASVECPG
jgi:hypothetical protein